MKKIMIFLMCSLMVSGCTSMNTQGRTSRDYIQMSALVGGELQGMREELAALRQSIDKLSTRLDGMGAPPVPEAPIVVDPQLQQTEPEEEGIPKTITFGPTASEETQQGPVEVPTIEIVREWGRDLETAAQIGQISTKGMTAYIPAGTERRALERLGKDLRTQYDAYDNISIDIFDDEEAANSYANSPIKNPVHRVIKIAKYKNTGQDYVVIYFDGRALEVY